MAETHLGLSTSLVYVKTLDVIQQISRTSFSKNKLQRPNKGWIHMVNLQSTKSHEDTRDQQSYREHTIAIGA